jgi:hypothetical protein
MPALGCAAAVGLSFDGDHVVMGIRLGAALLALCGIFDELSAVAGSSKGTAVGASPVQEEHMREAPVCSVGGNILLTLPGEVVAGTKLQRLGYYQWLWEPANSFDVFEASKADEAVADTAYCLGRQRTRGRHGSVP